jgi:cytochrome P450
LQGEWAPDGLTDIPVDDLMLSQLDPPMHTEVRANMARALAFRTVKEFESGIAAAADRLTKKIATSETADLVTEFNWPFVAQVLTLQTGLGLDRVERMLSYAKVFMSDLAAGGRGRGSGQRAQARV